ncbi:MAG: sel1 repeat family protein [Betaproteobacteria bacterium]|nr:sel1 repeat family protein [Betaproteobacteria bacterium]PWB61705.1 MAG: sel1 repeat family protein [Betaproteobacteria bacterium]
MTARHRLTTLLRAAVLAAAIPALAGPAEDYAAGDAAYRRGDVRAAMGSLRRAADAGHARAQTLLGTILDAAEQDDEAARYLGMAAAQGDLEATYLLAGLYSAGEGVPLDPAKARDLFEQAAAKGHRESIVALAKAYLGGGLGLDEAARSSPAALEAIRRAADLGHLPSLDRLAAAYRKGELGLAPDTKLAEQAEARARALRGESRRTPARRGAPAPRTASGG